MTNVQKNLFDSGGDAPPNVSASFVFGGAFLLTLFLSISAAQILGGIMILFAFWQGFRSTRDSSSPEALLGKLALFFIGTAIFTGLIAHGEDGALQGAHYTWMVLMGYAAARTSYHTEWTALERVWLFGAVLAALSYLVQFSWSGYADVWRYGFHRAPYIFSILLIAPALALADRTPPHPFTSVLWLICSVAVILAMSRGAVLAWVAGTATIFLLKDWKDSLRRRGVWVLLILLLLLFSGAVRDWNVLTFARQSSIRHRLVIWSAIIPEILAAPVFGHGFNNFHPDPMTVAPPYRNYLVEGRNPHNAYLMAFHAGGIFFYTALWFCYGILFWHLLRRRNLPGSSGRLARVSSGYLVALFVGSFFDKTLFTTLPTLQAWFLAGLALSRSATVEQ